MTLNELATILVREAFRIQENEIIEHLKRHPLKAMSLNLIGLLLLAGVIVGLVLDIRLIRSALRDKAFSRLKKHVIVPFSGRDIFCLLVFLFYFYSYFYSYHYHDIPLNMMHTSYQPHFQER